MKTIIANLKLYLPNRFLWTAYLYISVLLYFIIILVTGKKRIDEQLIIGVFMYLPLFIGFFTALMQIEILTKPFAFCLPGHKQNVKKVLFLIGIAASFIITTVITLILLNKINMIIIVPIFFMSMLFFLLGVEFSLFARVMLFVVFVAALLSSVYTYPYQLFGELISNHPGLVTFFGLLGIYLIWRGWNKIDLARKFCAIPLLVNPFDFYNKEKLEKYTQQKQAAKPEKIKVHIKPSVEKFFLDKMNKYECFR